MLLTGEELEGVLESGYPSTYHDPVLKSNRKKYLSFLQDLHQCGVIDFAPKVKVELGLFFVFKKNKKLRLIIDARAANLHFRRPPSKNNSSLAALSHVRVAKGQRLYLSQYDVKDFFYRIAIPWEIS